MMFKYDDPTSLLMIETIIQSILDHFTDLSIVNLASKIIENDLMKVQFPWYIRAASFIRRFDDATTARVVFSQSPVLAKNLIEETITHMNKIKTGEVGFGQAEIEKLVKILEPFVIEMQNLSKPVAENM